MLSPIEKEFYRQLNEKPIIDNRVKPGLEAIAYESKEKITQLLYELLEAERCYENWRLKFYGIQTFKSRFIFDKIDNFGKNYLSSFDVIL